MKFTAKRLLVAGVIGIAAIVTPLSLSLTLPAIGGNAPASATVTPPDVVTYAEGKGSSSNFIQYVPGNGGATTTESVTAGGGCSSPTIHAAQPLLTLAAEGYGGGYTVPVTAASVGAYQGRTGVCFITPDWAINNAGGSGAEGLDFSVGPNPLVAGRLFEDARLMLQSESGGPVTVELVEWSGTDAPQPGVAPVATEQCTVPTTAVSADTSGGGACSGLSTGSTSAGFDTVEVRDLTPNSEMSVVGPTSNFTMSGQICGGDSKPNTGPIPATVTNTAAAGTDCKDFFGFTSNVDDPNANDLQSVTLNVSSTSDVPLTFTIPWAAQPECQPDGTVPKYNPLTQCPPTMLFFNNNGFTDQSYCSPDQVIAGQICTTNKTYNEIDASTTVTSASQTLSQLAMSGQLSVAPAVPPAPGLLSSVCAAAPAAPCQVTVATSGGPAILSYTAFNGSTLMNVKVVSGTTTWTVSTGAAVNQAQTQITETWDGFVDCCIGRH